MKDFTKNIKLKFNVDQANYRNFDKVVKKLTKDFKLVDNADVQALETLMGKFKSQDFEIGVDDAKEVIARFEKLKKEGILNKDDLQAFRYIGTMEKFGKGFGSAIKDRFAPQDKYSAEKLGESLADKLGDVVDKGVEYLKKSFEDAFNNLNELLSYSLLTNDNTYELWQKGLTGTQAYGYQMANEFIGIGDLIEDGWRMSDAQRDKWLEIYNKQQEKYTRLYDSGYFEKLQEYQWEMKEFQQDVEFEFMSIIMANKDTIMHFFEFGIDFMEWAIKAIGNVERALTLRERTEWERSSATSDIISKYTSQTQRTATAVTIDNTWNIRGSMEGAKTDLVKTGQLTYEQVIRALGGTLN